jgi:signal peptidase II
MTERTSNGRVFWTTAVTVVILDQVTKLLAQHYLQERQPVEVLGEWARLTLAYNPGAAFSMSLGPLSRYIFGAFAVIALVILWRLYRSSQPGERRRVFALALCWGGASGNLIDRFRSYRGVVDFIDVGYGDVWRFWTFNVADSAVTIGAIILAIVLWQEDRRREQAAARAPGAERRSQAEV